MSTTRPARNATATVPLLGVALATALGLPGCDSREKELARQMDLQKGDTKKAEIPAAEVPPHPTRDKLMPLLEKLYTLQKVPPVTETDLVADGTYNYEVQAGVASVVKLAGGLSEEQKIRAIVMGTAEADSWAFRSDARRDYADLIHRVMRGYGEDQKQQILRMYGQLKLLEFFNSEAAGPAIEALPAEVKPVVEAMRKHYVDDKTKVWADWMNVRMYARRVVAGDQPFRSVLRQIKQELGQEEPPPLSWEQSMDAPFLAWAKDIRANEELLIKLTDLRELKDREEYLNETHSLWVVEGSAKIPAKAKGVKIDPALGFGVHREDLGGGYNELTFVFSKKLAGTALKKAYVRSIIYGQLLTDFAMLSTAGSDFAVRDADNVIDSKTAVVPDKYDPLYARCGSAAALDTFITHFKGKYPFLADMPANGNADAVLNEAHKCVIDGARGDIHVPAKDDDKDVEGPAPGSRLALYQMLARFENVDVNLANMASEKKTEEDAVIEDAEAVLKRIKAKENEGKGIK
ncbi:MAG: hypothetical protein U0168_00010 [Nannocystaceae bacterium]